MTQRDEMKVAVIEVVSLIVDFYKIKKELERLSERPLIHPDFIHTEYAWKLDCWSTWDYYEIVDEDPDVCPFSVKHKRSFQIFKSEFLKRKPIIKIFFEDFVKVVERWMSWHQDFEYIDEINEYKLDDEKLKSSLIELRGRLGLTDRQIRLFTDMIFELGIEIKTHISGRPEQLDML